MPPTRRRCSWPWPPAAGRPGAPADVGRIEHALYTERSLVRLLGMRRTMFVVPAELVPVIQAGCAKAVAAAQRRRYERLLAEAGLGDGPWLREIEDATARALAARGEATGAQLAADEPRLRSQLVMAAGKPYEARQSITSWVLLLLAADGRIVRGRPAGSWLSTQWRWAPAGAWLPEGVPDLPPERARVELARRWLAAFGPGTVADLRWWTGWPASHVRQALAAIGPGRGGPVRPDRASCCPRTPGRPPSRIPGWRCCPPWTPPRWAGPSAPGTWGRMLRR